MHSLWAQSAVEDIGMNNLWHNASNCDFGCKTVSGISAGLERVDPAPGVFQGFGHRVNAVDDVILVRHGLDAIAQDGNEVGGKFEVMSRFGMIAGNPGPV
jgi:hypothetical protein